MNDIRTDFTAQREALVDDLNALVADAQALLRDVIGGAKVGTAVARKRVASRLRELRSRLDAARLNGQEHAEQWVASTDRYVHDHPWQSIGAIAAVSALAGALAVVAAVRRASGSRIPRG